MRGHGLMQAIARVNRVFKDKPGGLVVDYLGLADELKAGARDLHGERRHRQDGHRSGRGRGGDAGEVRDLPRSLSWLRLVALDHRHAAGPALACCPRRRSTSSPWTTASRGFCARSPTSRRPSPWPCLMRRRCASATTSASSRRCGRCWRRARPASGKTEEELDHAIRQIISKAVVSDEVIDIFAAAGLKKPDISILSDEFLAEVRDMPQRNLAVELLRKLLPGRDQDPLATQRRAGPLLRRDAGAGGAPVPEPGHRDRPGDRGADRSWPRRCARPAPAARTWG